MALRLVPRSITTNLIRQVSQVGNAGRPLEVPTDQEGDDVTGIAEPWEVGPSPEELAAIEAEWPLIAADLAVTSAEIDVITGQCDDPFLELSMAAEWRRLVQEVHAAPIAEVVALRGGAAAVAEVAA